MQPVQMSSGDLVADRRASYAEMLFETGDHVAAADLMRDALALVPGWAAGWFRLGEMAVEAGRNEDAVAAFGRARDLDPQDRLGATLKIGLLGGAPAKAPPAAFVEALFDQYAGDFDAALVQRLDYRVPELLAAAILSVSQGPFALMLDLGCGTGLMGEQMADCARAMHGMDISAGMLARAEAKGIYDRLDKADLNTFAFGAAADLVTAADVFMYLGAMDGLVARLGASMSPGALFAFSVEAHDGEGNYELRPSRRFAHSEAYLRALLATNGFGIAALSRAAIRMDRGVPIDGLIVVARR